jgi:hypothetical protein
MASVYLGSTMKTCGTKWRIKSRTYGITDQVHVLQKRLFGFLWWYTPKNFDGTNTGSYYHYNDAVAAYNRRIK